MSSDRDRQLLDATQEALADKDDETRAKSEEEQIAKEMRTQEEQGPRAEGGGLEEEAADK